MHVCEVYEFLNETASSQKRRTYGKTKEPFCEFLIKDSMQSVNLIAIVFDTDVCWY